MHLPHTLNSLVKKYVYFGTYKRDKKRKIILHIQYYEAY